MSLVANVLIVLIALLSFVWTFRTGHEGAELAWENGPGGGGRMEFPQGMPETGTTGTGGAIPGGGQAPQQ